MINSDGLRVVDVTNPEDPLLIQDSLIEFSDAHRISVSRTYAYVAAGKQGLAILDVEKAERPELVEPGGAGRGFERCVDRYGHELDQRQCDPVDVGDGESLR